MIQNKFPHFRKLVARAVVLLCIVLSAVNIHAREQENRFSVSKIDAELLENADAVIRLDNRTFEYRSPGNGRLTVHKVVTILNRDGLSHARLNLYYDSFRSIRRIRGNIYDADGNEDSGFRSRDFVDEAVASGFSLMDDSRVKKLNAFYNDYPYSIEIEYQIDFKGFIQLPNWIPVTSERTSLENGFYRIELPDDLNIDYRTFNVDASNTEKSEGRNNKSYVWELNGIRAIEREFMGPPWFELLPAVTVHANEFSMDRRKGSMQSWNDFGNWFSDLWKGRDELPAHMQDKVEDVFFRHTDEKEIIRELYEYLQQTTRYVSIQLGIGGLQTETAEATVRNSYGDCKALSNYLLAMLRYAGFEAYPALIRNGSHLFPFDPEFVHNPFNHVIVYVPLKNGEEMWIEATSSTLPAGYIGSSNSNRYSLIFGENGSKLKKTPALTVEENFQFRTGTVTLTTDGKASAELEISYGSWQHEQIRNLNRQLLGAQTRTIRNMIPYNDFEINDWEISVDQKNPEATVVLNFEINAYAVSAGNRLLFYPNMMERHNSMIAENPDRQQPLHLSRAYYDKDEITYYLPNGYKVEALPQSVFLEFEYGSYKAEYILEQESDSITFKRELKVERGVMPADQFDIYREFVNSMTLSDSNRIVLVAE